MSTKFFVVLTVLVAGLASSRLTVADDEPAENKLVAIKGRCVSATGKPIVGARVTLAGQDSGKPVQIFGEIFAGKNGLFEFEPIELTDKLIVAVRATGHASRIQSIRRDAPTNELEIELFPDPGVLSGIVTGPDGKPVAGATVYVSSSLDTPIEGVMMDVTDSQGRYIINDLKRRESLVRNGIAVSRAFFRIRHPDFAKTRAAYAGVPQEVNVQLAAPAVIEGIVIDEVTGKPMPDVVVSAQGVTQSFWHQTRTDKQGRYQLRTNAEYFNIWADALDRIPIAVKAIEAVPGKRTLNADIRMVRGGIVVGTIEEAKELSERDRLRLRIAHYGPARPATGAAVLSTQINKDGTFRLRVAPGRNYVYLMNGSASVYVNVGDGQEVEAPLAPGYKVSSDERNLDPDLMLARKLRILARDQQLAQEAAKRDVAWVPGDSIRNDTPTGRLLDKLEDRNQNVMYRGPWYEVMMEIAAVGPDAVPDLIEELDATSSQRMMRCMGFLLRAIGDKRAVPALIRAIPKTMIDGGSDMGLRSEQADVVAFFQKHDLREQDRPGRFGFGRPVREVFGALQKLTGKQFGEDELYHVHRDGTERQIYLKERHFHQVATRWAQWWEEKSPVLLPDKQYQQVDLPAFRNQAEAVMPTPETRFKTAGGGSNMMLESVYEADASRCFYDLDTGRYAKLPQRWRGTVDQVNANMDKIKAWAIGEGFDMMGTEAKGDGDSKDCFLIEPLELQLWQLPADRWKMRSTNIALGELQQEGRSSERLLLFDDAVGELDREAPASFLYITSDGTAGIVFIGVQVRDNGLKAGEAFNGDDELRPIAFRKGRRFAKRDLVAFPN